MTIADMSSDAHLVTMRLVTGYQFTAEFPDVEGMSSMDFDEGPPWGDAQGPSAVAVLGAAVANCLAATLVNCVRRSRADVHALTAAIATRVERNEQGRLRVAAIDVELRPVFGPDDRGVLERCERVFGDYCTVTESVRQGIPVNVTISPIEAPVHVSGLRP